MMKGYPHLLHPETLMATVADIVAHLKSEVTESVSETWSWRLWLRRDTLPAT